MHGLLLVLLYGPHHHIMFDGCLVPVSCSGRFRYELTPESRAHINFKEQRQFGSLWKLLSELPDEPGVLPEEFMNKTTSEDPPNKNN